ncbi:unnamed protein product [Absidia cylindrospora]
MTTVDHLPAELLSLILQHVVHQRDLHYCALVNHAFYTETRRLLWRSPDLSHHHTATTDFFHCLATASLSVRQHVRTLKLNEGDDEQLLLLMKHARLLAHLHLGDGHLITDTSLQSLPLYCRHLTDLVLCNTAMTPRSFDALGQHCHHLSKLALIACQGVSTHLFSALKACPLEQVKLAQFDDDDIWNVLATGMVDLARFDRLTCLVIKDPPLFFLQHLLTVTAWPHLSHLALDGCAALGDNDGLVGFLATHPQLLSISLSAASITDRTLDGIAASLPKVAYVNVSYNYSISHHGVHRFVDHCPTLTKIDLVHCGFCWYDFPETLGSHPPYYLEKLNSKAINNIRNRRLAGDRYDDDDDDDQDDTDGDWRWQWR